MYNTIRRGYCGGPRVSHYVKLQIHTDYLLIRKQFILIRYTVAICPEFRVQNSIKLKPSRLSYILVIHCGFDLKFAESVVLHKIRLLYCLEHPQQVICVGACVRACGLAFYDVTMTTLSLKLQTVSMMVKLPTSLFVIFTKHCSATHLL